MPLYRRYQLLQKYVYELPFDPKTTKKSEEYTEYEYASESDCIKNIIRQWVDDGFQCSLGLKYQKLKEQISTDFGKTWEDSGSTKIGDILERQSEDCPTLKWGDTKIGDYLLEDKVTKAFVCATMEEIDNGSPLGLEQFTIIGQVTVPPSHGRYGNDKVGSIAYKGVKGCILDDNLNIENEIYSISCYDANHGFTLKTLNNDEVFDTEVPVYDPDRSQYGYEYKFDTDYKIYNNENPINPVPSCGITQYKCLILPYNKDGSINEDFDYPMNGMEMSAAANVVINDFITGEYTLYVPSFGEMAYYLPNYTKLTYIRENKLPVNFANFIMTINQCGWYPSWFLIFDTHCHCIFGTPACIDSNDLEQNVIYFVRFDGEKFIKPDGVKRWVESDDTMCDGTTKCKTEYEEVLNDGVWSRTGQTRPGEVIETESIDCGFSYPPVALKNLSTGKIEFVDPNELGTGQYTPDNYDLIGVVAATFEDNIYGDGTCSVFAPITLYAYASPFYITGFTSGAIWGNAYFNDIGDITSTINGRLTTNNMLNDSINNGITSWMTDSNLMYNNQSSNNYRHYYPAAYSAWRCNYGGTQNGDWYLPAIDEIKILGDNNIAISNSLNIIKNIFGNTNFIKNYINSSTNNGPSTFGSVTKYSGEGYPSVYSYKDKTIKNILSYDNLYQWIPFIRINTDGTILK